MGEEQKKLLYKAVYQPNWCVFLGLSAVPIDGLGPMCGRTVPSVMPFLPFRKKLLEYLYSLKQPDGSFLMHIGGEVDVR